MRITLTFFLSVLLSGQLFSQLFVNVAPLMGIQHSVDTDLLYGGNGVSFFDFDQDGKDDITFVQENDSILFYKNVNGVFQLLPSYIYGPDQTRQVIWVDYDNDGDYDLFRTATNGKLRVFQNDGLFNFQDVSDAAGLSPFNTNDFGVSFADYDRDGDLDFYLARYFLTGNPSDPTNINALYRNNGDGTFANVTAIAGVGNGVQPTFMGAWIDVNNDLFPDLYVINDRVLWGNSLYLNNGDGTFTDITSSSNTAMFGEDPMGVTFEDFDNDHDLDILCSNGGPPTKPIRVYENEGNNVFEEIGAQLGIHVPVTHHCTWGATWFDAQNDGHRDLYIATGLLTLNESNETRSYLFMNDGNGTFTDTPAAFESPHIAASYAVAKGDINNDGYTDLVVQNAKGFNSFIWRNKSSNLFPNNYVKVSVEGVVSNRMGIGAWIYVYTNSNSYSHYTRCGENFVSQSSQNYIFGLGDEDIVDSIIIYYPSGIVDKYYDLFANQHYHFIEGESFSIDLTYNGQLTLCEGDSLTLDGGDLDNHTWNTGDSDRFLTVNQSGQYYVATNLFGLNLFSDTVNVQFLPQPLINYSLAHPLCHNDSNGELVLDIVSPAQNANVVWSNGHNGLINSGLSEGTYSYEYMDEGGCEAKDTFELVDVGPLTIYHQILANGSLYDLNLLVSGGTAPYFILLNGLAGELINTSLAGGIYEVEVEDVNGCSTTISLTIGSAEIEEFSGSKLAIYPNPSRDGRFNLEFDFDISSFAVYDMLGRKVSSELEGNQLVINSNTKGAFSLWIESESGRHHLRLIVN
jgi:hypothetical protein